ncbi:MAG TPA: O-antigen ligase family protein [Solirubrobacterales bacterium]|nr:O-antigen ligase family protein [Solirubrobacterales bacterium]
MSAELLEGGGILAATGLACAAILLPPSRRRSVAMVAALALVPILVLGDQWDSARIVALRDTPWRVLVGLVLAAAAIGTGTALFRRWPWLIPLAIAAALPFRVPLQAGGDQANLLLPLYLVIAAGVVYVALRDCRPAATAVAAPPEPAASGGSSSGAAAPDPSATAATPPATSGACRWLPRLIAVAVALYGLQALYSADTAVALLDIGFFLVPFSLVFVLVREAAWTPRLLFTLVAVFAVEALVFSLFGFWEYLAETLIWNPEVIRANEFHTYFRVNSLFWDPNMFGRHLALVIVALTTLLLWSCRTRTIAIVAGLIAILWLALVTTFSLSSFGALLAGLAVLAGLRWSARWAGAAVAICLIVLGLFALFDGGILETERGLNNRTSGRGDLITGGLELFADRPVRGHGSASFSKVYLQDVAGGEAPVSESHTEPVTVAVEQGLPGLAVYLALLAVALVAMGSGLRGRVPGLGGDGDTSPYTLARAAILAAFVALLVHTMSYAGFLEDPVTWLLLGLACALPAAARDVPAAAAGPAQAPAAPGGRATRQTFG